MISIRKLTVAYKKGDNVLNSLNLELFENTINGIVGLNGAGKTTLLNTIFGLIKPNDGEVLCKEKPATKKEISYLVTENFFYANITGREYLGLFKNKSFEIEKWNQLFLLPLDKVIDGYSTGMRKKLALMATLKQDKPIMILDEPFNGLDIETCRIIRTILLRLKAKNKTVIITSHIIETLTNLCDYIHFLEKGEIKFTKDKSGFAEFEAKLFEQIENENENLINELV